VSRFTTRFGSLDGFEKGYVEPIDDDPRHYAFSNIFDVASRSQPYEHVAVGKNRQYVLEVARAEGTSAWRTRAHDQSALVMDGEVRIEFRELGPEQRPDPASEGSATLDGEPAGRPMGHVVCRRGHMALLPAGAAYRFDAANPGVLLIQSVEGPETIYRWSEICQMS
jgi:hypothetical protein